MSRSLHYMALLFPGEEKTAFFQELGDHIANKVDFYQKNPTYHQGLIDQAGNYASDANEFLTDRVRNFGDVKMLEGLEDLPTWSANRIEKLRKSVPYKALGNLGAAYLGASIAQDDIVPRQLPLAMVAGTAGGTALSTAYQNVTDPLMKQLVKSKSPWALPLVAGNFMAGKAIAGLGAMGSRRLFQRFREMVDKPTFLDRATHSVTRWGSDKGNQNALVAATALGIPAIAAGTYAAHKGFGLPYLTDFTRRNNIGDGGHAEQLLAEKQGAAELPELTVDELRKVAFAAALRSPLVWNYEATADLLGQEQAYDKLRQTKAETVQAAKRLVAERLAQRQAALDAAAAPAAG